MQQRQHMHCAILLSESGIRQAAWAEGNSYTMPGKGFSALDNKIDNYNTRPWIKR